jgi:hypothetical protein
MSLFSSKEKKQNYNLKFRGHASFKGLSYSDEIGHTFGNKLEGRDARLDIRIKIELDVDGNAR